MFATQSSSGSGSSAPASPTAVSSAAAAIVDDATAEVPPSLHRALMTTLQFLIDGGAMRTRAFVVERGRCSSCVVPCGVVSFFLSLSRLHAGRVSAGVRPADARGAHFRAARQRGGVLLLRCQLSSLVLSRSALMPAARACSRQSTLPAVMPTWVMSTILRWLFVQTTSRSRTAWSCTWPGRRSSSCWRGCRSRCSPMRSFRASASREVCEAHP